MAGDLAVALGWLRDVALGRAGEVRPVPGGVAVLHAGLPGAHDHNRLLVTRDCGAAELADAADAALSGAGLRHRLIDVDDVGRGRLMAAELRERGYTGSERLLLAGSGPPQPPASGEPVAVERLELPERVAAARADWRRDQPGWPDDLVDQLGRRIATVRQATRATFAARGDDGRVLARADLYERDGVAQVEEVMTSPEAQGRGLASALVRHAVAAARAGEARLVFLVADADDWPQHLYRRLGFRDLGRTLSLTPAYPEGAVVAILDRGAPRPRTGLLAQALGIPSSWFSTRPPTLAYRTHFRLRPCSGPSRTMQVLAPATPDSEALRQLRCGTSR